MTALSQAISVEMHKARRSKMPIVTALGFMLLPLVGAFFMIVLKDPELARRMGIISSKAQMIAGGADWQTYLGMLAQGTGIGGVILFSLIGIWVFGREYSDHTLKDLLALPTPRSAIVVGKLIVIWVWCAALIVMALIVGLIVGNLIALPQIPLAEMMQAGVRIAVTGLLTLSVIMPIVFFANAGRGYLPAFGAAMLVVFLSQIIAAAGWGEYFPWSIPALYAGMAGPEYANLGIVSFVLVIVAGLIGIAATLAWWQFADQAQ